MPDREQFHIVRKPLGGGESLNQSEEFLVTHRELGTMPGLFEQVDRRVDLPALLVVIDGRARVVYREEEGGRLAVEIDQPGWVPQFSCGASRLDQTPRVECHQPPESNAAAATDGTVPLELVEQRGNVWRELDER